MQFSLNFELGLRQLNSHMAACLSHSSACVTSVTTDLVFGIKSGKGSHHGAVLAKA
jgi:hypothetical protein